MLSGIINCHIDWDKQEINFNEEKEIKMFYNDDMVRELMRIESGLGHALTANMPTMPTMPIMPTNTVDDNTNWEFKSSSEDDINWDDIINSLTYAEPLALITRKYRDFAEPTKYVAVSGVLLDKAHTVGMFEDTPSILDMVVPQVFEIDGNFSDWVSWAKDVKASRWTNQIKSTFSVILPTV